MSERIKNKFQELKTQKKAAFVAYICAGDPDYKTCLEILKAMPENGADLIELGIPFLDPAGDGPTIEAASKRSIKNGITLKKVLQMCQEFRKTNSDTPIILMGYYNSFLKYCLEKIFADAEKSGADGVLIVDLPLEERDEIAKEILKTKINFINLIAPLTDETRIKKIVDSKMSGGFLYLISMLGITGTKLADPKENIENIKKIKNNSDLPIAIGFGIQAENQAKEFSKIGIDAVVIGSVIVKEIENNLGKKDLVKKVLEKIKSFSEALKN